MNSLYDDAHLFVAALRILEDKKGTPPSIKDICDLLGRSQEWGELVCRQLSSNKIIKEIQDPFAIRIALGDHTALENLPREENEKGINSELEKFQQEKAALSSKVDAIQSELNKKKEDLFAKLNEQLRKTTD